MSRNFLRQNGPIRTVTSTTWTAAITSAVAMDQTSPAIDQSVYSVMKLCSNRPVDSTDSFATLLDSCFIDVFFIPACTWLFFFALTVSNSPPGSIAYYFTLCLQFLISLIEIIRLYHADLGIGLLPFVLIAIATAGYCRESQGFGGRVRRWKWINLCLWWMLLCAQVCKINMLVWEGSRRLAYGASAYGRTGTGFSVDEQAESVRLMMLLYIALCFMEFWDIL